MKHSTIGGVTILPMYVDDIIVTENDKKEQEEMKQQQKYFLGIEEACSKQRIFISQKKYVVNLLKKIGRIGCK